METSFLQIHELLTLSGRKEVMTIEQISPKLFIRWFQTKIAKLAQSQQFVFDMHDSLFSSPVKPLKVIVNASPSRFVFASLQKEQRGKHVNSKEDQIGNNTYEFVV